MEQIRSSFSSDIDKERLTRKLACIRKENNMPQYKLAEHLGVSPSYVCNIECFRTPLSWNYFTKFVAYFELDEEELLSDNLNDYQFSGIDNEIKTLTDDFLRTATQNDKLFFKRILTLMI